MFRSLLLVSTFAAAAFAGPVAGVVSLSPNISFFTTPPASLSTNTVQSDSLVYGLVEKVNYTLSQAQYVDLMYSGGTPLPGFIPAGTLVNSYFLHYDPATGTALQNRTAGAAQIQFQSDARIIGLQFTIATLTSGVSGQLMAPGVSYETNNLLRGIELVSILLPKDSFSMPNPYTLNFTLNSSGVSLDEMRVIVALPEAPEPSYALLMAPVIGLFLWRRRRMATKAPDTL